MTSLPSFFAASTTACHSASLWAAAGAARANRAASVAKILLSIDVSLALKRADSFFDETQLHPAKQQHQNQHQQPDAAHLFGLAAGPHLQHHDRQDLGIRRIEQDRGAELAHDAEEDQYPADREIWPRERHQDAEQGLPPAGAVHARAF